MDRSLTQVESLWFTEDPETHRLVVKAIREAILNTHPESQQIVVKFRLLQPNSNYRVGKHFLRRYPCWISLVEYLSNLTRSVGC
ncbi:DUF1904 family protein [uncultured Shewanella sp.]|uniref:DUF1904 family protein n=1 Tax=Shewanella atlantica TaxID=271099 RepID=UPI00262C07B1|nr:DUF1904 family protein [uncultured Shewanella sp.]